MQRAGHECVPPGTTLVTCRLGTTLGHLVTPPFGGTANVSMPSNFHIFPTSTLPLVSLASTSAMLMLSGAVLSVFVLSQWHSQTPAKEANLPTLPNTK